MRQATCRERPQAIGRIPSSAHGAIVYVTFHPATGRAQVCAVERWRASEAASRMEINVSDFAFYPGNAFDSVYQADGINDQ